MNSIPNYLDRYPAKLVMHLGLQIIEKYAKDANCVLDPFCGSSGILKAAQHFNIPTVGIDINPYAILLSRVKLEGFDKKNSEIILNDFLSQSKESEKYPIDWDNKNYWFEESILSKYEKLRYKAKELKLRGSRNGRVVLLSFALSIRLCSKADPASPKPFISKRDKRTTIGDPYIVIKDIYKKLSLLYGDSKSKNSRLVTSNFINLPKNILNTIKCSHIITSPPYINAQDYFRNFKFELYFLNGIIPFIVDDLKLNIIGTEHGDLKKSFSVEESELCFEIFPKIKQIKHTHPRLASIIYRYLINMNSSIVIMNSLLEKDDKLVLICGDNLMGGYPIPTSKLINKLVLLHNFEIIDQFKDKIVSRMVPLKRNGHNGIIKSELITAFKKN